MPFQNKKTPGSEHGDADARDVRDTRASQRSRSSQGSRIARGSQSLRSSQGSRGSRGSRDVRVSAIEHNEHAASPVRCGTRKNIRARHTATKRLTVSAMFATLALIFTYVEVLIPVNLGVPGVKLGLANLVIILALYNMNFKYAFTINLIRIVLSGLLFSGVFAMLYSLAGGICSLLVMWLLKKSGRFSLIGVSMAAAVAHNFGQLLTAALMVSNIRLFIYYPVLVFSGIIAGIGIGIFAFFVNRKLPPELF